MGINPFEIKKRINALRTAMKKTLNEMSGGNHSKEQISAALMALPELERFITYFSANVPYQSGKEKVEKAMREEFRAECIRMAEEGYARK